MNIYFSLSLVIFGTLGFIAASFFQTVSPARLEDCYDMDLSTLETERCIRDEIELYKFVAIFKDICITLSFFGILFDLFYRASRSKP